MFELNKTYYRATIKTIDNEPVIYEITLLVTSINPLKFEYNGIKTNISNINFKQFTESKELARYRAMKNFLKGKHKSLKIAYAKVNEIETAISKVQKDFIKLKYSNPEVVI